jgi:hypothetical protein
MVDVTPRMLEAGDRLIQFGYARKAAVRARIDFARPFDDPPTVVITPLWETAWEDARREVGHAETIGRVAREGFVLYSNNGGADYYVSWIAIGYAGRGRPSDNVNYVRIGDLILEMGRTLKTNVSLTVPLGYPFARPPNIQVSPFWDGQRSGVGHAETIGRVTRNSFDVWSDNRAPNYWVSWIAAGTWRTDLAPDESLPGWSYQDFPVRDMLVRTVRGRFRDAHSHPVLIGAPQFAAPPTVVVSPFWEGENRGVGHAETLNWVEPHMLMLTAGNGAPNYFVSMLAIGPPG